MDVSAFYSNPDLSDGFGATAGRTRPHRGLDFAKPLGTPIPSLGVGVVVTNAYAPELGYVIEVDYAGWGVYSFMGHAHMDVPGLPVGTSVAFGTTLGFTGNSGTATTGPHDHITLGDRQGAVFGASMSYLTDPWPAIQRALNTPTPAKLEKEDEEMNLRQMHCTRKSDGKMLRALHVPGTSYFIPWTGSATYANRFATSWETGSSVEVSESLFNAIHRAAEAMLPKGSLTIDIVDAGD